MIRLIKLAMVLVFLKVCLWQSNSFASDSTIPFKLGPRGHMLVPVRVNNVDKTFIFDTGAGRTALNKISIEDLNLDPDSFLATTVNRAHDIEETYLVTVKSITLGEHTQSNLRPVLMELGAFESSSIVVDGIIGFDIFSQYDIHIDYKNQLLHLKSHNTQCAELGGEKFELMHGTHIKFNTRLANKTVPSILDTGASSSTMNIHAAELLVPGISEHFKSKPGEQKAQAYAYKHAGGNHQRGMLTIGNIEVAEDIVSEKHNISVSDIPLFKMFGMGDSPGFLFAADLLKNKQVNISYACQKIAISN